MYYIYLLQSNKDGNFYIDYSSDLKSKVEQHVKGNIEATKHRRSVKLI